MGGERSTCLPLPHAEIRALYVMVSGSTSVAFISPINLRAVIHRDRLSHAVIRALK